MAMKCLGSDGYVVKKESAVSGVECEKEGPWKWLMWPMTLAGAVPLKS